MCYGKGREQKDSSRGSIRVLAGQDFFSEGHWTGHCNNTYTTYKKRLHAFFCNEQKRKAVTQRPYEVGSGKAVK